MVQLLRNVTLRPLGIVRTKKLYFSQKNCLTLIDDWSINFFDKEKILAFGDLYEGKH